MNYYEENKGKDVQGCCLVCPDSSEGCLCPQCMCSSCSEYTGQSCALVTEWKAKMLTNIQMDALECAKMFRETGELFDVVLLDPPYNRKSMELYKGNKNSRFKQLLDVLPDILTLKGWVITFGYHSRVMSGKRGFRVREICLISHGGAQHDTIASVEERVTVTEKEHSV